MNTTLRTSLVALLALIPILVLTGCSTPTPGVANPAGTTSTSTSAASPTVPNSAVTNQPPAESPATAPESTEPSPGAPSSQEPSSPEPAPDEPTVLPTDLSGEVYGFIHAVDVAQSEITLDKVDWFWGADAEQACAVDNVSDESRLNGWCSVYYFRNVNPKLRVVSVNPDAVITTLEGTTPVRQDLQGLADHAGRPGGLYNPYRILVMDGAIVELAQIYQP